MKKCAEKKRANLLIIKVKKKVLHNSLVFSKLEVSELF